MSYILSSPTNNMTIGKAKEKIEEFHIKKCRRALSAHSGAKLIFYHHHYELSELGRTPE